MASHDGSRKRVKLSREGNAVSAHAMPTPSLSASAAVKQQAASPTNPSNPPCHHEKSLHALHADIDAMRQLITCKICDRFMYEPYALSCGHTYCYSCLSQWLVSNRKKTCPDCRCAVTQQPTPSYIIRELVLIFVSRNELLADGETTDEHNKFVQEEAEIVAKDKANTHPTEGGLFRGAFVRNRIHPLLPRYDPSDDVHRCPDCMWELEDGYCAQCGIHMYDSELDGDYSGWERDTTDDELDHEFGGEDDDAHLGADGHDDYFGDDDFDDGSTVNGDGWPRSPHYGPAQVPPANRRGGNRSPVSSEVESEDDEDDPETRDFIVDDDHVDYASSEEDEDRDTTPVVQNPTVSRRRVISSDEEDENETADPESGPESEDEGLAARVRPSSGHARLPARHRRTLTISSDDEDDGSDDSEHGHESDPRHTGGFSPLYESTADGSDEESEPAGSVHPMREDEEEEASESDATDDEFGY